MISRRELKRAGYARGILKKIVFYFKVMADLGQMCEQSEQLTHLSLSTRICAPSKRRALCSDSSQIITHLPHLTHKSLLMCG